MKHQLLSFSCSCQCPSMIIPQCHDRKTINAGSSSSGSSSSSAAAIMHGLMQGNH